MEREIVAKLKGYKEKMVSIQQKLYNIEKKCNYGDADRFGMYQPLIEAELEALEVSIMSCEACVERAYELVKCGELLDATDLAYDEVAYSEGFIKPKIKKIDNMLAEAIKDKGVFDYE